MIVDDTLEMLAFNLKLVGQKTRKNVLVSIGTPTDKERLLPSIRRLVDLGNVALYATHGTSQFLTTSGVANQELFKIAEKKEPNIRSFLAGDRFDCVINILVGDHTDETSDNRLIRTACIEHGIPLITDLEVAAETIRSLVSVAERSREVFRYKIADPERPWDARAHFLQHVADLGGFACYHAHFDRAYMMTRENLKLAHIDMQKKWDLVRYFKENFTPEDLIMRMSRCLETMIRQGVTACRTHVDADKTVGLMCLEAALEVKKLFAGRIRFQISLQPAQGLLDPESRAFYAKAAERADFLGGLPSRDRPTPEKHLDILMDLAKNLGKGVDVHIDQENNPDENETELLALKTIEHGLEGRVQGIHAISLASKPEHEQDRIFALMKDAGLAVIICPSAALSMKALPKYAPLHNSIAPMPRLLEAGIPVYLGVDNIHDVYMPLVDGDLWYECRTMMEACRFYDTERVASLACDKRGFEVGTVGVVG